MFALTGHLFDCPRFLHTLVELQYSRAVLARTEWSDPWADGAQRWYVVFAGAMNGVGKREK